MKLLTVSIFTFLLFINNCLSDNNYFKGNISPSSDVFSLMSFNNFDGRIIFKQTFSIFGTEQVTVAEIKINDSKVEFILKRNDNPSYFVDENYDKMKLIMKIRNNSLEIDNVYTAKNYSSNWKKLNLSNKEKKMLRDTFNVMNDLWVTGTNKMDYQKRNRIDMHSTIKKILKSLGLNNTMEISGEQMTFDAIIDKMFIMNTNNDLIKLNLRDYGVTFVGETCIEGRRGYIIYHDLSGIHLGYYIKDVESGLHTYANWVLNLYDDTRDKMVLSEITNSSFKNNLTNCIVSEVNSNNNDIENKLRKLKALLDDDLITQEDYDKKKFEYLNDY